MANINSKKPKFTPEINAEIVEQLKTKRSTTMMTGAILTALGAQIGGVIYLDQTLPDMQRYQYKNIEDCACDYPRDRCKIEKEGFYSETFGPWFDAHDYEAKQNADGKLCAQNHNTNHGFAGSRSYGSSSYTYSTGSKRFSGTQSRGGFGRTASRGFSSMG